MSRFCSLLFVFAMAGGIMVAAGCAVGVEPLGSAPVTYDNPDGDTAERTYLPIIEEHATEDSELRNDWEADGRPAPAGGWTPYWEHY